MGGRGDKDHYQYSSQIDIYDDETRRWTTHTASEARYNPQVAVVGKKAIFFGGYGGHYFSQADIYDDETGNWTTHTTSNTQGSKAIVSGSKAIFFCNNSSQIDIYDDETDVWTSRTTKIKYLYSYIIQGNKAALIGSDIGDNMLKYEILGSKIRYSSYDVIDNNDKLLLGETKNIFETNITNKEGHAKLLYEEDSSKQLTSLGNFKKLLSQQVINKPGWFIVEGNQEHENIRESFLVLPKDYDLPAITEQSTYKINKDETGGDKLECEYITGKVSPKSNFKDMKFSFMRLNITGNVRDLRQKAYAGGPKRILTLESQKKEQPEFARFNPTLLWKSHTWTISGPDMGYIRN